MCIVDSSLFAEKEPDMLTPFTVLMPANIRFGRGQALSAAPWLARPLELQEAGVRLGDTYPLPVVEHDAARQRTLERYAVVKTAAG